MATPEKDEEVVLDGGGEEEAGPDEEPEDRVKSIQSHYLRCPSPTRLSTASDRFSTMTDRFSMISGFSNSESIFMEPIHLSSAIAAKKIINEELPKKDVKIAPVPESMLESAEQLMVEDLYNRVKDMIDDRSLYNTPCVLDIQRALIKDHVEAPFNPVDEVWPNIFIGEKSVAVNKARLKRMGITHVLNAAHGTGVYTGQAFYSGMDITYMGIEVDDFADADISPHFRTAAEFLDEALLTHRGKVLVDSMMGVSRSAVLVAAYLMIFQDMTIMDALTEIRKKRAINPNEGFIKQLRQLNENLQEERDDEDNETLSQCSVIDTLAQMDEEESLMGVKAHSIMMEEEGDCASVMSSVASSAAALRAGIQSGPNGGDTRSSSDNLDLPGKEGEEEEDDDINSVIREWQRRNEKYQNDDWWEAQLMSECEDDGESVQGERKPRPKPEDLDSVTSEDVRVMREMLKKRRDFDSVSSVSSKSSCSSYSDLWKQRLREIEEQAASRYKAKENEESEGETDGESGSKISRKKIDDELESIMSDSSSMYNFCKKNKDSLSVLERWKVKRIHYGWNKKEAESDTGSVVSGGGQGEGEGETPTPSLEDVNLTAYQTWKLKQQKKYGGEENKNELLDICRGADSATAKRRQRREELLERSRKTLEESQSVCGWDSASSVSGSSIPLSAFCAGAFPAASVAADDSVSMLSGRSRQSQARSVHSQPPAAPPQLPPLPPLQTPDGEPMVNLASIQNWISNVVVETLMQKQGDLDGSVLGSVLGSLGGRSQLGSVGGRSQLGSVRGLDDDKVSMLSGASGSSYQSRCRAESVLSAGGTSRPLSEYASLSGRKKVTTTSVPLYSLFQDEVNLNKLDSMDKEMKLEMRDKMAAYEKKKITEDNKRSTLYKKKKPKDEDEDEEQGEAETSDITSNRYSSPTTAPPSARPKIKRDYGRSGRLNLSGISKDATCSIDEWLKNVRPPSRRPEPVDEDEPTGSSDTTDYSRNGFAHTSDDEEVEYRGSRYHASSDYSRNGFSQTREEEDEAVYSGSRYCASADYSRNGYSQTREEEDEVEYSASRYRASSDYSEGFRQSATSEQQYQPKRDTEGRGTSRDDDDDDEEDVNAYISQIRQRCRERVQRELEEKEDEVLAAWRTQEELKSATHK
ncbi:serine/threonine/tyrosine-interacting-like protein 2 [Alosa alosa]|uniref:serine/threonine/tyrosine-interacting-like protein 2 n=1 Tax=Alosa alosa TaxID=278164 RepID=UPI0020151224|nr:serine/threonine/tyrosine-interacting-like protein 2 [Alosa alosa]